MKKQNSIVKEKFEAALKRLEKCGGDCKHCEKCHIYTASTERALYYAFGCDVLPQEHFSYISDSMRDLKKEAVGALTFELA